MDTIITQSIFNEGCKAYFSACLWFSFLIGRGGGVESQPAGQPLGTHLLGESHYLLTGNTELFV